MLGSLELNLENLQEVWVEILILVGIVATIIIGLREKSKEKAKRPYFVFEECHECGTVHIRVKGDAPLGTCTYCGAELCDGETTIEIRDPHIAREWKRDREEDLYETMIKGDPEKSKKYEKAQKKKQQEYLAQQKAEQQWRATQAAIQAANRPRCPRCGSPSLEKTGPLSSAIALGVASQYNYEYDGTFHCHNCGLTF